MAVNIVTWIGGAFVYNYLTRGILLQPELAIELIISSLLTAVISVLATFFCLQFCIQRWLAPVVFPRAALPR